MLFTRSFYCLRPSSLANRICFASFILHTDRISPVFLLVSSENCAGVGVCGGFGNFSFHLHLNQGLAKLTRGKLISLHYLLCMSVFAGNCTGFIWGLKALLFFKHDFLLGIFTCIQIITFIQRVYGLHHFIFGIQKKRLMISMLPHPVEPQPAFVSVTG